VNPDTARARIEKARDLVGKLCTREQRWTMSVPVDMKRDSDMVLGVALEDGLAAVEALVVRDRQLEEAREFIATVRALSVPMDNADNPIPAPLAAFFVEKADAWLVRLDSQLSTTEGT